MSAHVQINLQHTFSSIKISPLGYLRVFFCMPAHCGERIFRVLCVCHIEQAAKGDKHQLGHKSTSFLCSLSNKICRTGRQISIYCVEKGSLASADCGMFRGEANCVRDPIVGARRQRGGIGEQDHTTHGINAYKKGTSTRHARHNGNAISSR